MRISLTAFLSIALFVSGCAVRLGRANDDRKAERLALERGRLTELTDPVQRTKSYIVISTLLLDFVTGAASDHQMDAMESLLDQYGTAIQSARDTIVKSDRDPTRSPAGYKDLELAVRQHMRRLEELSRSLPFDGRKGVERAVNLATTIRAELIRLLFPQSNLSPSFRNS